MGDGVSKYTVKPLEEKYEQEAYDVTSEAFVSFGTEPLCKGVGLSYEGFREFIEIAHKMGCTPDTRWTSKVVTDKKGQVQAAAIAEDFPPQNADEAALEKLCEKYPKFNAIFEYLGKFEEFHHKELDSRAKELGDENKKFRVIHIFTLAVRPSLIGNGFASKMTREILREAQQKGYDYAYAECTNTCSASMAEKEGAACIHEIDYDTFEMEFEGGGGVTPFKGVNQRVIETLKEKNLFHERLASGFQKTKLMEWDLKTWKY